MCDITTMVYTVVIDVYVSYEGYKLRNKIHEICIIG